MKHFGCLLTCQSIKEASLSGTPLVGCMVQEPAPRHRPLFVHLLQYHPLCLSLCVSLCVCALQASDAAFQSAETWQATPRCIPVLKTLCGVRLAIAEYAKALVRMQFVTEKCGSAVRRGGCCLAHRRPNNCKWHHVNGQTACLLCVCPPECVILPCHCPLQFTIPPPPPC